MSKPNARGIGRVAILASLVVLGITLFAPAAHAHAELVRSDPPSGATLAAAPDEARLWFSEDVAPDLSSARLLGSGGRLVAGAGPATTGPGPRALTLSLPELSWGTYTVLWQVLAQNDGHTTKGVVVFAVGAGSASSAGIVSADSSPSLVGAAIQWLRICLLAGVVGGIGVTILVLVPAGRRDERLHEAIASRERRVLTMVQGASAAGVGLGLAFLLVRARATAPGSLIGAVERLLSSTRWGHLWLLHAATLVLLTICASVMRSAGRRAHTGFDAVARWTAVGLVVVAAATEALWSHAASLDSGRTLAIAADSVHVLTALLWMGALPALILILWPRTDRSDLVRACRGSFTSLAVLSVVLIVATGLFSAGREVLTLDALTATGYGRLLLTKTGLLVVVGTLGLVNSARLHGWKLPLLGRARSGPAGPVSHRLVAVEAGVGAVLLLAAGLLADSPPANRPVPTIPPPATRVLSTSEGDLLVTVSVTPDRPGINVFTVLAVSSRRPPPALIDHVTLSIEAVDEAGSASTVPLELVEPGRYLGTATLDRRGPWRLTAVVRRAGRRFTFPMSWTASAPALARAEPPAGRRLAPIANGLAILLALGTILLVGRRIRHSFWRRARHERLPEFVQDIEEHVDEVPEHVDHRIPEVVS